MTIRQITTNLNIVQGLSDLPNATDGLSAGQLKAKFDEGSNAVKTYINGTLIPDIETDIGAVAPGPQSLFRQAIVNGNFDIWQRGTSFANTGGLQYYADRWAGYANATNQACTISRQPATGLDGSEYCLRFQRNAGQTGTSPMVLAQSLESADSKKFIGKVIKLVFMARKGAGASSDQLLAEIVSGTGTDQNTLVGFTGSAIEAQSGKTLTENWQEFSLSMVSPLGSARNQLAVRFTFTPTGTAGTNDYFEIAQVQLGNTALSFQPKSVAEELRLCKRYYEKSYNYSVTPGTMTNIGSQWFDANGTGNPVYASLYELEKRITPTVTFYNPATGVAGSARDTVANVDYPMNNGSSAGAKTLASFVIGTPPAGNDIRFHFTADAEL